MPRRRFIGLTVVAALALAGCGGGGDASGVPDIAVRSLVTGEETSLASLDGTPMVLNLWAPWCAPCRQEMPDFDEVAAAQGDAVRIVGLATGTEEDAAKKYAAEVGVSYELFYDIDDEALGELAIAGLPATLFVAADGTIVESHNGVLTAEELTAKIGELLGT
jgi:thiol-disulfide isomerase/thioredoxin